MWGCSTDSVVTGAYAWPVPGNYRITDGYGNVGWRTHGGIDIGNEPRQDIGPGNDVVFAQSGTVVYTNDTCDADGSYGNRCGSGFGNYVKVEGIDGVDYYYAHLHPGTINVKVGDNVTKGQQFAKIGDSGSSTAAHLHYEVRERGSSNKLDPWDYLPVVS
jgi:murein DD-endopeptidase MepM/ murein hydrolase activator NlpD